MNTTNDRLFMQNTMNSLRSFITMEGPQNLTSCMNHVGENRKDTKDALACGIELGWVELKGGKYSVTQPYYLIPSSYR